MRFLIKNGRVWDGEQFFTADVLTEDETVTAIAPQIDEKANFVFDAEGMIVSAGLVDCHMHFYGISSDIYGIRAEMGCLPFGVTAAADAGSNRGSKVLMDSFAVKTVAFADSVIVNDQLNETATYRHIRLFGDKCVGIKLFYDATSPKIKTIRPLQQVCAYARKLGLKVMVHCNHSPTSMLSIVETLSRGDILSHVFHGGANACYEDDYTAFRLARQKGVILDAAFAGHVHTDFAVFTKAIADGQYPTTISTDLTKNSAYKRGGRYGLPMCMSMARTAGMAEADIFRAVTTAPGKALGQAWGRLTVGGRADIAVLAYENEGFQFTDNAGNTFASDNGYRCKLTVADGVVLFRD